ncbi:YrzA family protein [Bacillus pumilus]|uniref:YrzA family protein n=1 Tax=Bacillus pumilus TaxID=1408 RepID=UPI00249365AB|nr:YrzA family protein [Bacillus pumilus]
MDFQLDFLKDKIEFFEASSLKELEQKIQKQIEHNQAILLTVHSVRHQTTVIDDRILYTAVVHFKANI